LDIVAPSGDVNLEGDVWSLDQMGNQGWNPAYISDCPPGSNDNDYDCRFGGTSAACPVVSGTAALLLSRDSTLSAQAVYYILRNSAVTHLDWGTINPPDDEYGYGRVDAYRAILSIARGDVSNDAEITIGDVSILIDHIFLSGVPIALDSLLGDISCDGAITMADISILIDHLFISGDPLPLPCFEFND